MENHFSASSAASTAAAAASYYHTTRTTWPTSRHYFDLVLVRWHTKDCHIQPCARKYASLEGHATTAIPTEAENDTPQTNTVPLIHSPRLNPSRR